MSSKRRKSCLYGLHAESPALSSVVLNLDTSRTELTLQDFYIQKVMTRESSAARVKAKDFSALYINYTYTVYINMYN